MRCAINTLPFVRGGGITYLKNILPLLSETEDHYFIFVPANRNEIDIAEYENIEFIEVQFPTGNLLFRLIYEQIIFPVILLLYDVDVLFSPTGITTLLSPCPAVNAVRNPNPFNPLGDRSLKRRLKYRVYRFLVRLSIKKAVSTIYVSEYTREIVSRYMPINRAESYIIYHGIDVDKFIETNERSDEELHDRLRKLQPFIVCVSSIKPHKNYETLIEGFANLPQSLRTDHALVVAGASPDQDYYERIINLVETHQIENQVEFLGAVDYEQISLLYSLAEVSVLPSKLETFGHPLVESMAAGTPVVAADSAAIPEIVGDAACLFDPHDSEALADCLQKILLDDEYENRLINLGNERVKDFSWETAADETHKILKKAANKET